MNIFLLIISILGGLLGLYILLMIAITWAIGDDKYWENMYNFELLKKQNGK